VQPGYHSNKRHWNTVELDGTIDPGEITEMVEHSYTLVRRGLPKAVREQLERDHGA
jgi:predicted DNA-binding protein (MmcQ/YjbR family)